MKESIISSYEKVSENYIGNSNSLHKLGFDSKKLEDAASKQILDILGLSGYEVIYTSGNCESFSTILDNVKGSVITDNNEIRDICVEMGIDVSFNDDISCFDNFDNSFISTVNDKSFFGRISHIDLDLNKKYSNLNSFDFITIEDEIPFFGVLIKKKNVEITNLIHGGKSSTKYRSGTAVTPLIVSFAKLVKLKYKK